ncbi:hypothetical protein [Diaphorobacter sp.]|uniref:hypothetical protein n=1 Tax=Diaphorobacter sp. TaxID=1934310 RepID=UPI0028A5BC76|nr:hypothetical protein [Diaphorobacter sp.]
MVHSTPLPSHRCVRALLGSALLLTAMVAAATSPRAHAATLADVRLVNRHTGQVLPVYRHQGELWVAGRPGGSYSVDITNRTGQRILAVLSVDGVNAITGESASAAPKDGYVLDAGQSWGITGWRKSDSQVAAFYFSESGASYASRTGRPHDVGVIGVALYRERWQRPISPPPPIYPRNAPAAQERSAEATADMAEAPLAAAPNAAAKSRVAPSPSPTLGTGHGALETSYTSTVDFVAATQRPEQIVRIRYDSFANLVARGVIRDRLPERVPNPFPAQGSSGYVPDPPRW